MRSASTLNKVLSTQHRCDFGIVPSALSVNLSCTDISKPLLCCIRGSSPLGHIMTTALEGCNRLHALGQAVAVLACQGEVAGCLADAPAVPAVGVGASLAQVLVQVQVAPLVGALSTPLQTRTFTCTACSGDVNFQSWHSLDCISESPDKVVKGRKSSPTSTMHLQKRRGRGCKSWSHSMNMVPNASARTCAAVQREAPGPTFACIFLSIW